jgi:predicted dehydrogenase
MPHAKWLDIAGTAGTIRLPDFINPADANDTAWEVGFERVAKPSPPQPCPAVHMFRRFAVEARRPEPDRRWAEVSLKTQQIQDACLLSARHGRPVVLDPAGGYHLDPG